MNFQQSYLYWLAGLILLIVAVMSFRDKANPRRVTTGMFWGIYGLMFLLGALHGPKGVAGRRVYGGLAFVAAAVGMGIAGRHVWVQVFPPEMPSCGPGWDYLVETNTWLGVARTVLSAKGDCSTVDWSFLGLSMPMWSLLWFVLLGGWALYAGLRKRKSRLF